MTHPEPTPESVERLREALVEWLDTTNIQNEAHLDRADVWIAVNIGLAATPQADRGETEPCPTCGQPVDVPQRGDHDYGMPLTPQAARGDGLREAALALVKADVFFEPVGRFTPEQRDAIDGFIAALRDTLGDKA